MNSDDDDNDDDDDDGNNKSEYHDRISSASEKALEKISFGSLKPSLNKTTKKSIRLRWKKVKGANKYVVYGKPGSAFDHSSWL